MNRFGLYGKLKAHAGKRDLLAERLLEAATLMEGADGCELYVVGLSASDEDTIWVTEIWQSRADHDASLSIAGVQALIQSSMPLIHESESIRFVPIGGKGLGGD